MKEIILLKEGEIALKGLNKRTFEESFIKNLRHRLKPLGKFDYTRSQSMIYCEPLEDTIDMDEAVAQGIESFRRCCHMPCDGVAQKDFRLCTIIIGILRRGAFLRTHVKVQAKRFDKRFPMKSPEICAELGGSILEKFPKLDVDVKNPDVTVNVEIRDTNAYIHTGNRPAAGGIPVRRTSGRAMLLLSGGIDSPVAGYMMAKRGIDISAIHYVYSPIHLRQSKNEGRAPLREDNPMVRRYHILLRSLYRDTGSSERQLPRRAVHHHHAPPYDGNCPEDLREKTA